MAPEKIDSAALVCGETGLVHCLGAAGITVYTGTEEPDNPAGYSRYSRKQIRFSSYDSEQFIRELCDFGRDLESKPVLMSYDDRLILNISRNRDELLNYYRFLLPEKEMVERVMDKIQFIGLSEEFRLPVPASVKVSDAADLDLVPDRLKKPYLVKPVFGHHWFGKEFPQIVGSYKKAFVCHSLGDLKDHYERIARINPDVVIQEYIEGPDDHMYDVNMYVDAEGIVRGCIIGRKIRVYPPVAGFGSYVVTVRDEEIRGLSVAIAEKLTLRGLVNVQFKRDVNTGKPKLIEIHTRTSIFDVLGIKSGMNVPALYFMDMAGMAAPLNGEIRTGVKYVHVGRDLRLFLKNRKSYGLTVRKMAGSYRGPMVIDGFSLKDPVPFVMDIWRAIRKMLPRS